MFELQQGGPLKDVDIGEKMAILSGSWQGRSIFALLEAPRYQTSPREIAVDLNISLEILFYFLDLLESVGLVKKNPNGQYYKTQKNLDFRNAGLDKQGQLEHFKNVASEVLVRQSPDGKCRFESSIIFTNQDHLNEFLKQKNSLIDTFIRKSADDTNKDLLVGYQYAIADMIATGGAK